MGSLTESMETVSPQGRFQALQAVLSEPYRTQIILAGLALSVTLLNCVKPLHIDDAAYWYYARQMASQPLDPYGFALDWSTYPATANEVLAPPVLPAWWAIGIKLFGDHPFLWKLWLFPICWLFVSSLYALFQRFARGNEMIMTCLVALSPVFLPSLNLMLDIPALALGLTALRLFFLAAEGGENILAALAGVTAGLAMETKYTAFLVPAVMILYGVLHGQLRVTIVAVYCAGLLFGCWELIMYGMYGQSHFMLALQQGGDINRLRLAGPFVMLVGGVGAPLLLLSLLALGGGKKLLIAAIVAVIVIFAVLPFLPAGMQFQGHSVRPEDTTFFVAGCVVLAVTGFAVWRLCKPLGLLRRPPTRPTDFLLLWLLLELAGYFVLTPFPAVRRIMGFEIVDFLLLARLANITCRSPQRRRLLTGVAIVSSVLGLAFWGVDLREAYAQQIGAREAVASVRKADRRATIWYVGHWGFQFHMERLGAQQVIPAYSPRQTYAPLPAPTVFRKGDWLIQPDKGINQQDVDLNLEFLEEALPEVTVTDFVPWRTVIYFYGGPIPIRHEYGPRLRVKIYRVKENFAAQAK